MDKKSKNICKTVVVTAETYAAVERMAVAQRRTWAAMARLLIEDGAKKDARKLTGGKG